MAEVGCTNIFVYGTLKRGQPNHPEMAQQGPTFVCSGVTESLFPLIIGSTWNLPFLLFVKGTGKRINGEIYKITPKQLSWLDYFEGHPDLYEREKITVITTNDEGDQPVEREMQCWCYFFKNFDKELLNEPYLDTYDDETLEEGKRYKREEDIHHRDEL
ncbi:hypothetical protein ScPMuIL_012623 [Solemya velum]